MSIRIYVASLADYNCGEMLGDWIDVSDVDTVNAEIAAILRRSRHPNVEVECPTCEGCDNPDPECEECKGRGRVRSAEEWACFDHECDEGKLCIGESPDIDELCKLAESIEEHGEAFLAWHNNSPADNTEVSDFEDQFLGHHKSLADYVQEFWEESGFKAEPWPHPTNYINWESLAKDWELNGDVWTEDSSEGGVYIFANR